MLYIIPINNAFVNNTTNTYNKIMKLKAKEIIKVLLTRKGVSQKELVNLLNEHRKKPYSYGGFTQKIYRETLTYDEVALIADLLGFDIEFVDRKQGVD